MKQSELGNANFRQAILYGCDLSGVNAAGAIFVGADLRKTHFGEGYAVDGWGSSEELPDLTGADFSYSRLSQTQFLNAIMINAKFVGADTSEAVFTREWGWEGSKIVWRREHPKPPPEPRDTRLHFGFWLNKERSYRGLTAGQLAKDLTGIDNCSYVRFLEGKDECPSYKVAIRLSEVLDVPLSEMPIEPSWFMDAKCPRCGQENRPSLEACENCGRGLRGMNACLDCGNVYHPEFLVCPSCGVRPFQ